MVARELEKGALPADPMHGRNVLARAAALNYLRARRGHAEAIRAARLLLELPWPDPSSGMQTEVLWNRAGGEQTLPYLRVLFETRYFVAGRIAPPRSRDTFSLWIERAGALQLDVLALDEGFRPLIHMQWRRPDGTIGSNTHGGARDHRQHTCFAMDFPEGQHWLEFEITGQGLHRPSGPGRYMLILQQISSETSPSGSDPAVRDRLAGIRSSLDRLQAAGLYDDELTGRRYGLLGSLRQPGKPPEVQDAAELLVRLPWPDAADRDHLVQWIAVRSPFNPDHDGGIHLLPGQSVVVVDRILKAKQLNSFRLILDRPGALATRLVSLTPGFCVHLKQDWWEPGKETQAPPVPRSDASAALVYRPALSHISSIADFHTEGVVFYVKASPELDAAPAEGRRDTGEYLLYVWQPE